MNRVACALLACALVAAAGGVARAQIPVATRPAFSVERFTPAPGGGTFIGVEPPDVLPAGMWTVTSSTWLAGRPIVLRYVMGGALASEPVRLRWGQEVDLARGLGSRYQLGLALPAALQWGDRLQGIGLSEAPLDPAVLGDIRLHARVRITGHPAQAGLAAALAGEVVLPTGDDGDFAGEKGWMLGWGLRAGWRGRDLEVAGGVGLRIRTKEVVLLSPSRPHGDELAASGAIAWRFGPLGRQFGGDDRAWLVGEIEAVLGDSPGSGRRGPSPAEARLGARAWVSSCWSVAVAFGGGLTPDEIGSPSWRAIAQVTFDQAPPRDRDGDGINDGQDACPLSPEDHDGTDDWDGCPDPDDDNDGIPDVDDQCPHEPEDHDGFQDTDGCPDHEERMPTATDHVGPSD